MKEILILFFPVALFLPFLTNSIIFGTPSTQVNGSIIGHLLSAISSGAVLKSLTSNWSLQWLLLVFPIVLILDLKKITIVFATLLLLLIVFFSIDPSLWGESKYQIEWFLPFSILGLVLLVKFFIKIKIPNIIVLFLIGALLLINIVQYKSILEKQEGIDHFTSNHNYYDMLNKPIYRIGYDYKSAYKYIIENNLEKFTYSVGVTYGVFPELLNDYSVENYRFALNNYEFIKNQNKVNNIKWTSADENIIDSNKRINYLLVGYMIPDKDIFIEKMINKGWSNEKQFYNEKFKSTIYLLKRNF